MAQHGKKYELALGRVDREKRYGLMDAIGLLKDAAYAKFDETVELVVRLGVDPRKSDQMVRGTVLLPHGIGKDSEGGGFCKRGKREGSPRCRC